MTMTVDAGYLKHFTSHLYRFFEEGHILKFSKMRKYVGKIDWYEIDSVDGTATVVLDHRYDILPTIIHEFLHYKYPEWPEKDISEMEKAIVSKLSSRRVKNIIKKFADAL